MDRTYARTRQNSPLALAMFAAAALAVLFIVTAGPAVHAASVPTLTVSDSAPPVVAVKDDEGGVCRVGEDISVYGDLTGYCLFLPSTADLSEVKVRYTGSLQLYDQDTGALCGKGGVLTRDFSAGSAAIYEYDASSDNYLKYTLKVMKGSCASLYITLNGGRSALIRINSSQDDTENGSLRMSAPDGSTVYDGGLTKLKGHGLTSYEASGSANTKNSYNINLENKAELIEGAGKSKKWTLLRIRTTGSYDPSGMSYLTAFYTYDALVDGDYFNITARYADVYINGEYRGAYILTERMDINGSIGVHDLEDDTVCDSESSKRVRRSVKDDPAIAAGVREYTYCPGSHMAEGKTDITGGYVLEIMCGFYGEYGFQTAHGEYVNIKSPEYPTKEQVQYIAQYVQNFENAIFSDTGCNSLGKYYADYIDEKSYAAQTLVYAYYLNWEIYRTSTYFYKDADGSAHDRLTFGPVWDFESGPDIMYDDTLFGVTFAYDVEQQYLWFEQMWKKGDYMTQVSGLDEEMKGVIGQLLGKSKGSDIFRLTDKISETAPSQNMNWIRWRQGHTFTSCANAMVTALSARYNTWFGRIWDNSKYLLGLTVKKQTNADGSVTYTAAANGKNNGDYQWYRLGDDKLTSVPAGSGSSVLTVSDGGTYYCTVSGPNNAYCQSATGNVFSRKTLTMTAYAS